MITIEFSLDVVKIMNRDEKVDQLEAENELLKAQLVDGNQEYQRVIAITEKIRTELLRERSLRVSYEKLLDMAGITKPN
ncbi:hypothetical protein [Alteromonas sp. D210916BOD_24]|uniref:hypothetical protein n=1 Tax=Alteromonas sp. D210916BOD_24 TaxID=3157618 RepID=UPI00399D03EA